MALGTVASSNTTRLDFKRQSAFGEVLSGATADGPIRFTSETLSSEQSTEISDELTGDAQISDSVRTDFQTGGAWNLEWSLSSFDEFVQATVMDEFGAGNDLTSITGDEISTSSDTLSVNATTGDFITTSTFSTTPLVGDFILTTGFTNAENNGWFRVSDSDATTCTIEGGTTALGGRLVTESGTTGRNIFLAVHNLTTGDVVANGQTLAYFTVERDFQAFSDAAEDFTVWRDSVITSFNLSVPVSGKITGSFNVLGSLEERDLTQVFTTPGATRTNSILNSISNVTEIAVWENPLDVTAARIVRSVEASSWDMTLNNNAGRNQVIGTFGAASMRAGSLECSGNIQAYFTSNSATRLEKFLDQDQISLSIGFIDAQSEASVVKGLLFFYPAVKLSTGTSSNPGRNQVIFEDLAWNAFKDGSLAKTVFIYKIDDTAT